MKNSYSKISHYLRYVLVKYRFRYLVRYRYYIIPILLVVITILATTALLKIPAITAYLSQDLSNSNLWLQNIVVSSLPLLLILGASLYLWMDYIQHSKSLNLTNTALDIKYSFYHHIMIVILPLLRYKWKPLTYVTSMSLLIILTFLGTASSHITNVEAASTIEVTINQKTGSDDPNPSYTSVFSVSFSEAIDSVSFISTDLTLGGTAPGQAVQSISEISPFDSTNFEVRISATSSGTITPSIDADQVIGLNGPSNTNQASTSSDNSVTYNGQYQPEEFITTWKTDNPGLSNDTSIILDADIGTFDFDIDWDNDGTYDQLNQTTGLSHDFGVAGTYTIRIRGDYPSFGLSGAGRDEQKFLDIVQWGTNPWEKLNGAFSAATNVQISAVDAPDLSDPGLEEYGLANMFNGATAFNSDINHWDVSNITSTRAMFANTETFDQPLNNWSMGSVTDPQQMFYNAEAFNQPLDSWDTSNFTTLHEMFEETDAFNQPLNDWDTQSVTIMTDTFRSAAAFNQPLENWDTSNVETMASMFVFAEDFNQDISGWDVGEVTTMSAMFAVATSFDQSLADWNIVNVTNMTNMFTGGSGLSFENYDDTISAWNLLVLQPNVTFDGGTSTYCLSADARQNIIDTYSWTINDSGKDVTCPDPPGTPQNLTGTPNVTAVDLDWDDVADADSYAVEYKESASAEWTEFYGIIARIEISQTFVPGLKPSTSYNFRVKAIKDIDPYPSTLAGDWSDTFTTTTLSQTTYTISDCEQFQGMFINRQTLEVNNDIYARYELTSDIDCSETQNWYWSDLDTDDPVGFRVTAYSFAGELDGQGHTVTGIYQNSEELGTYNSVFYNLYGAVIKDITFKDMVSVGGNQIGLMGAGLANFANLASISNVHFNNLRLEVWSGASDEEQTVSGSGGLIGNDSGSNISTSSVTGQILVNRPNGGDIYGPASVGGLVGTSGLQSLELKTVIQKSFSDVSIELDNTSNAAGVGGIVGRGYADIANSYSTGDLSYTTGVIMTGGLAGWLHSATIRDSYSSMNITAVHDPQTQAPVGGLIGLLQSQASPILTGSSVINSFAVGTITAPSDNLGPSAGLIKAVAGDSITLTNNYYDQTRTTQANCYTLSLDGEGSPVDITDSCTTINVDNSLETYFVNNKQNPPLNLWDFDDIWRTEFSTFPTFVGSEGPNPETPGEDPEPIDNPPDPEDPPSPGDVPVSTTQPIAPNTPTNSPTPQRVTNDPIPGLGSPGGESFQFQDIDNTEPKSVSDIASQFISWLLLLILLILTMIYAWRARKQFLSNKQLINALNNLQASKEATDTYIKVVNHHLNTPVAIMSGAVELLNSQSKIPKNSADHLLNTLAHYKQDVSNLSLDAQLAISDSSSSQALVGSNSSSADSGDNQSYLLSLMATIPKSGSALKNPAVFVPIAIVSGALILVVVLFANAQLYQLDLAQQSLQLICLLLICVILAATFKQRETLKIAQNIKQQAIYTQQRLIKQRNDFIDKASSVLSNNYENLKIASAKLTSIPETKTLFNGLSMLSATVASLTSVSRLSQPSSDPPVLNLSQEIAQIANQYSTHASAKKVNIKLDISQNTLAKIQPQELQQIIGSTLDNAIRFSPENTNVIIKAHPVNKHINISITDQGPGIPKDKLDQLFQPFTKTTDVETYNQPGLGLSLYVNKLVVTKLGGDLKATNSKGSGLVVNIRLPREKKLENSAPLLITPKPMFTK